MNFQSKHVIIFGVIVMLIIIVGVGFVISSRPETPKTPILSFEDCARAYPVMESYPRQCRTPDGRLFAEELPERITYTNATADMITVELPFPGAVVGKEFSVIGKARGTWFFEASFPVEVIDGGGKTLAVGIAQAQGDWMTVNFVPFSVNVKVPESYIGPATIILKKDNPSGLSEYDASISFPITIEY
ncbi:MAG: Gmad2 immunoglobulin-like domain-containing protein [Candidatus Paceibacterota bacterium]|jgi:hypothetical protein